MGTKPFRLLCMALFSIFPRLSDKMLFPVSIYY